MWVTYFDGSRVKYNNISEINFKSKVKILHCRGNNLTSLQGIENLVNLEELNCGDIKLTTLQGIENLVNLNELNCSFNRLTSLHGIENLVNLEELNCTWNNLTSLKGIENLVNLKELDCQFNKLTYLQGIENLVNLKELYCSTNKLTSLQGIANLVNLEVLNCHNDNLTSLKGIENLVNLKELDCQFNKLTSLQGIENLVNLGGLDCSGNKLTSINEIIFLPNLEIIHYDEDKVIVPPTLRRRLLRQRGNIYGDSQNVHERNIQETLKQSIIKLINTEITYDLEECIKLLDIKNEFKSYNFNRDLNEILNSCQLSFREIVTIVLNRIIKHPAKEEIRNVLLDELKQGSDKCFVGKVTRIINVLNGFDPDVSINISDNEQISIIANKIFKESKNDKEYRANFVKEMENRGFKDYEEWLNI